MHIYKIDVIRLYPPQINCVHCCPGMVSLVVALDTEFQQPET